MADFRRGQPRQTQDFSETRDRARTCRVVELRTLPRSGRAEREQDGGGVDAASACRDVHSRGAACGDGRFYERLVWGRPHIDEDVDGV